MKQLLMLYACCIPVAGARRAVICDLQRGRVYPIPHSLYTLFDSRGCIDPEAVAEAASSAEQKEIFDEYVTFLTGEELAFFCTEAAAAYFPPLSRHWEFPAVISNGIIDADGDTAHIDTSLLEQLAALGCNHLQFRFFSPVDREWLHQVMLYLNESQVKSLSIVLAADHEPELSQWLEQLMQDFAKIQCLTLHGSDSDPASFAWREESRYIRATRETLTVRHCGLIAADDFSPNIPAFTEALNYNSCLNRKLSIDAAGLIGNCPSLPQRFGHVGNTRLADAVTMPEFRKYWRLTKDQIAVCQDCEFRYICTDCRAYVEEPGNDRSKPLKCGYDPYTATWQDWSQSPLKQQTIIFYGTPLPV